VWAKLQEWLTLDSSRRCTVGCDSIGYQCRLSWDTLTKPDPGGVAARSRLGIADAVANALQAATESGK
jgi:hypothetical protein